MEKAPDQGEDSHTTDHHEQAGGEADVDQAAVKCPPSCQCRTAPSPAQGAPSLDQGAPSLGQGVPDLQELRAVVWAQLARFPDPDPLQVQDLLQVEGIVEVLVASDPRGLAAQLGPQALLAHYREAVGGYRQVVGMISTIVQFLLRADLPDRLALQQEVVVAMDIGGVQPFGPSRRMAGHRSWLVGLLQLRHYLEYQFPAEFAAGLVPAQGCPCMVCGSLRQVDSPTIERVFTDPQAVARQATAGGLAIVPVKALDYLRHTDTCTRALVEDLPCSCGLALLVVGGA